MSLDDNLKKIIDQFEFETEEEKEEVIFDLIEAINMQLMINLSADESYKDDVAKIQPLIDSNDIEGIQKILSELISRPDFSKIYENTVKNVLTGWTTEMALAYPEEKQREISNKINALQLS